MNENETNELEVLTSTAAAELQEAGLTEPIEGEVHVVLGTGGQTAYRVSGEGVTVADVIQGAAQQINPNARVVIREVGADGQESIRFTSGDQEVYLLRAGNQVSGAGLNTQVQPGDAIVTGRRHSNG